MPTHGIVAKVAAQLAAKAGKAAGPAARAVAKRWSQGALGPGTLGGELARRTKNPLTKRGKGGPPAEKVDTLKNPDLPAKPGRPIGPIAPFIGDFSGQTVTFGGGDDSVRNEVVENPTVSEAVGSSGVRSLGGGGGGTLGLCDQVHNWVADGTLTNEQARIRYGQCFD